mmetsp:Transcript_22630/g.36980  ORF Transcript_22630/g.36980 Transcript_22630/m.36980 type:complete len:173 (+) Transcript_22630:125-643(+)
MLLFLLLLLTPVLPASKRGRRRYHLPLPALYHPHCCSQRNFHLEYGVNMRKELGVVSLFFLLCHAIMSLTIWNAGYFYWSYDDPTNVMTKYLWHVETSMFFGIVGFGLYTVLGICSLPSVADAMTSRQWKFVYGVVSWTALIFGLCHNLFIAKNIMQWRLTTGQIKFIIRPL